MTTSSDSFSPSGTVTCKGCGEEGPTSRRFCGNCGQQLSDPCLACGEKNSVAERYCGSCGDSIEAAVAEKRIQFADCIRRADELAELGRFIDAAALLGELPVIEHSELQELIDGVSKRLKEFPERREQVIAASQVVAGEARVLIAERRYHQAHKKLIAVPEAFRHQELRDLLAEVQSFVEESDRIRAIVKQSLAKKAYAGLLPQVDRLVELNPDDAQLAALRAQLAQRETQLNTGEAAKLAKVAAKALAECNYAHALEAVNRIASSVSDERIVGLIESVRERAFLAEQVRTAPFIGPTLVTIAQRFAKLQPHDKQGIALAQKLVAKWKQENADGIKAPVAWAKDPGESMLGVPVNVLPLPELLQIPSKSGDLMGQSLLVCFGLALQAIGAAEVEIDLAPKEKSSWLGKVYRMGSRALGQSAWGIVIGGNRLKAVQLGRTEKGGPLKLLQHVVMPVTEAESVGTRISFPGEQAISRFLEKHDVSGQVVAINLPGAQTLGRFFDMPAPKPSKFAEAMEFEMRARIPLEIEKAVFDFHSSELPPRPGQTPRRRVVLVAANREIVEQRVGVFRAGGAARMIVQCESIAIHNAVRYEAQNILGEFVDHPVAIVEIGTQTCNFAVLRRDELWFRGLFLGSRQMDNALAKGFKVPQAEAEALRLSPEKHSRAHRVMDLLLPEYESVAESLHRTIDQYQRESGNQLKKLYLCGSGAEQFGLIGYLRTGK